MPTLPNSVLTPRANISEVSPQDPATQPSSCLICAFPYSTTPPLTVFNDTTHKPPIRLPCGHTFGQHCLRRWVDPTLSHGATRGCPLCRAPLPPPAAPVEAPQRASGLFYFPVFDEGAGSAESGFAADPAGEVVGLLQETDAMDEICELLLVWLGGGGKKSGEEGIGYASCSVSSWRMGGVRNGCVVGEETGVDRWRADA